ncbi:hypothetical protein OSB04_027305 [Centaurea solstitialis]|uniref:Dehydrin n=1 Tax=Centaurea solstitialis TaxID=347529 RepID=A0AA38W849_9ASTR|nr:hypothetical protein OSB04_027305 [Centaurea solstitialis]
MAQYGSGDQYVNEGNQSTNEYGQNPLQSTTNEYGQEIGGTGTTVQTTPGYEQGGKHEGGILHRSGSGSSSSSEDDGEGGRRKKKGVMQKIKEKLPGGDHAAADEYKTGEEYKTTSATAAGTGTGVGGGGYGYEGAAGGGVVEGHEKKGIMEKIKEKLPGGHQ